jgi:hypothetical protein
VAEGFGEALVDDDWDAGAFGVINFCKLSAAFRAWPICK